MVAARGQPPLPARRRQLFTVGLAAGQHGQDRQLLQVRGHHVGRQPAAQVRIDLISVRRRGVPRGAVVGGQLDGAAVGAVGLDGGLGDAGHGQQHRFDLGQFHPVTADLDLGVDPAVVLDFAAGVDLAQIAGPVDPAVRVARDGQEVADEGAFGQVRAVEVAAGQADPGDADLAQLAGRQRAAGVRIEDDHGIGGQRHPDRHRPVRVQQRPRRGHGGLGGAVDVEEPPARPVPAADQVLGAGFPGDQQEPQPGMVVFQRGQQGRHAAQRRYPAVPQERVQVVAQQVRAGRLGHQGGPGGPRHPDLLDGEVERDRHALVHPVVFGYAVDLGRYPDKVADAGVGDRHPLRAAGRARGVDDVAQVIRRGRHLARPQPVRGPGHCPGPQLIHRQHLGPGSQRFGLMSQPGMGQHQPQACVRGDERQPVAGKGRIERHVRGMGLQYRQHGGVAVGRLVEQQADPVSRPHPAAHQEPGQPVRAGIQLRIRQRHIPGVDGEAISLAAGAQLITASLKHVLQPLTRPPPGTIRIAGRSQDPAIQAFA